MFLPCLLLIIAGHAGAQSFMEQRKRFRTQIDEAAETKLDQDGTYTAVIFRSDRGRYDFHMTPSDRLRIKDHLTTCFESMDSARLERFAGLLNTGHFLVSKQSQSDGTTAKVVFLSPTVPYWDDLTDVDGIESMFHVYDFSVGLYAPGAERMYVVLQTEGEFFGVSRSIALPLVFTKDSAHRTLTFSMPSQTEIVAALEALPAVQPGRASPREKFIDACRRHPYFQQRDKDGDLTVSDKDIDGVLRETILEMAKRCDVKESTGRWRVDESFRGFLLVEYSLKTRVNVDAVIPAVFRFAKGALGKAAQSISDAVSIKYLPLSMKDFRDSTQERAKRESAQ